MTFPSYTTGDFPPYLPIYQPAEVVPIYTGITHLVYPRCYCDQCKRQRGELPPESAWIPAMRPEDV